MLGGRAAESIIFGETSSGAADDLAKATSLARDMVTRYGMDERIGPVVYDEPQPQFLTPRIADPGDLRRFSEATAREVELAVREHVETDRARMILEANRQALDNGAALLLLTHEQLPQVRAARTAAPVEEPRVAPLFAATC